MASQYYHEEQKFRPSATGSTYPFEQNVPFDGFYVLMSYLLTGEDRVTYSRAITPLKPFNPSCPFACPGAWELIARVSQLEVDERVFVPGKAQLANPATNSHQATELTLGFNWYFNTWVRMQFNWEHDFFADPVQLGGSASNLTKYQDTLLTRFQIIF